MIHSAKYKSPQQFIQTRKTIDTIFNWFYCALQFEKEEVEDVKRKEATIRFDSWKVDEFEEKEEEK